MIESQNDYEFLESLNIKQIHQVLRKLGGKVVSDGDYLNYYFQGHIYMINKEDIKEDKDVVLGILCEIATDYEVIEERSNITDGLLGNAILSVLEGEEKVRYKQQFISYWQNKREQLIKKADDYIGNVNARIDEIYNEFLSSINEDGLKSE